MRLIPRPVKIRLLLLFLCLSGPGSLSFHNAFAADTDTNQTISQQISRLQQQLRSSPGNVDLHVSLAKLLLHNLQYAEALVLLQRAAKLAPDYEDIYLLEAIVLSRQDNRASCLQKQSLLNRYQKSAKQTHAATIRRHLLSLGRGYTEIATGLGYDNLSKGRDNWQAAYVQAKYVDCDKYSYHTGYEYVNRYNTGDSEYHIGVNLPFKHFSLGAEYRYAGADGILAKDGMRLELNYTISKGVVMLLRHQQRDYGDIRTSASGLGIDYYFSDYQISLLRDWIGTKSDIREYDDAAVNQLRLSWYYGDRQHIGLIFASGDELSYDNSSNPPFSKINSLIVTGKHALSSQWALVYELKRHQQGDFFNQTGARLGVQFRY